MCGRYTIVDSTRILNVFPELRTPSDEVESFLSRPHYNIAPGQDSLVIRQRNGALVGELMRWGFVPHWVREETPKYKMINARAEEVDRKPAYRQAFRAARCLIPADGFYEWRKLDRGGRTGKIPYYIRPRRNDGVLLFAGLYSIRYDDAGEPRGTFTILTTSANRSLAPLHPRMPVILPPEHTTLWLDPRIMDPARLKPLLVPAPDEQLTFYPVSPRVNSPAHDLPECIEPYAYPDPPGMAD